MLYAIRATLQAVSRVGLQTSRFPTYTPTPIFPMRTLLSAETERSGRLGPCDHELCLACMSRVVGTPHARAAWMCDHETPGVNCINPYFSEQQRRKRLSHENTSSRSCADRHCSQRTGSIIQSHRPWRYCHPAMHQTFVKRKEVNHVADIGGYSGGR